MTIPRVQTQTPSIGTATLEHTPDPAAASTAQRSHTTHRPSSRGADVVVDHGAQSPAHSRLRAMQQRVGVPSAGAPAHGNSFDTLVRNYTNQIAAGRTPTAPTAPPLPTMSGRDIIARVGITHPDFAQSARQADRDARAHEAFSPIHAAIEAVAEPIAHALSSGPKTTGALVELGLHAAIEVAATSGAGIAEPAAVVAVTAAIADSTSLLTQEIVTAARGQAPPSVPVREALADEVSVRAEQWIRTQSERAETSFSAGVRRAADGLAPDPARANDRAYMLGVQQGTEYRRTNGDAYSRVVQHDRAMEHARHNVDAMPHGASASPASPASPATPNAVHNANPMGRFVPVTQLERDHVGVDFHIDG